MNRRAWIGALAAMPAALAFWRKPLTVTHTKLVDVGWFPDEASAMKMYYAMRASAADEAERAAAKLALVRK